MAEFINNISQFIENQFPRLYREEIGVELTAQQRSVLVDFVEAYYEFLEENYQDQYIQNRQMFEYRDVDQTLDEFIIYFRKKYLDSLVYYTAVDERFLIKNIIDLYRSKGSEASIKLLIRLLFNEDATVYFPGRDVLKASDSQWVLPRYIEVISSPRSRTFLNKKIFGSVSGASAFVEGVVTKRANNTLIDVIYLSDISGIFIYGDTVSDDGVLAGAPYVIGSLSSVTVGSSTVGNNAVGEIFDVLGTSGKSAKVKVTSLLDRTGSVDFSIADGGYGYTLDSATQLYISDIVILKDNTTQIFTDNDRITQRQEKISFDTDPTDFLENLEAGDDISGWAASNNEVANGNVLEIGEEIINEIITPYIIVQPAQGTFTENQILVLTANADFRVGENVVEGKNITLSIDSANGSFANGEIVYQRESLDVDARLSSRYAFGTITDISNTEISITNAFGVFEANSELIGTTSGSSANTANVQIDFAGVSGEIIEKLDSDRYRIFITDSGYFSGNNQVRGSSSKIVRDLANTIIETPDRLRAGGQEVDIAIATAQNYSGIVIAQNTTSIGIGTSSDIPFIYIQGISTVVNQDDVTYTINAAATGVGATFELGTLSNEETITTTVERISDENIVGVTYDQIYINGVESGVGLVNSISVIDGGTGYTNSSTISFTGGGFSDQPPLISASALLTTDSNGSIVSIDIIDSGEGYFTEPSISISDGSGANVSLEMLHGYGFPAIPFSNVNTVIGDVLTDTTLTIGTIASLKNVFKGRDYTGRPYVKVVNPTIASYTKKDQIAGINLSVGSFATGEIIEQANTGARGLVKAASVDQLEIRNLSFDADFELSFTGGKIVGTDTGAEADINSIRYDSTAAYMGENAVITNFVVEADGTINTVEIINSGIGYVNGEDLILKKGNKEVPATAIVQSQGIDPGFWKTRTSHLNSEKRLHDNNYYQEYSYDIQSGVNLNEYRDIILDVVHLSGTKLFGTVIKTTEKQEVVSSESTISQS